MTGEMADNNTNLGAALDITKLKVQDLKKELKARGLNTTGNKNDLIERLQAALRNNDSGTNESVDDLDEDLLNEDDDLDATDSVINNIDAALNDTLTPKQTPIKRKAPSTSNGESTENKPPPAKKLVLNRNPSIIKDTRVSTESKDSNNDQQNGKKVIKISEISVKERLEMRASKFGVSLSTEARKVARAERFGLAKSSSSASDNIIKDNVNTSIDVLKQRAERFGGSVSKVMSKIDQKERLEQRKKRFGEIEKAITTTAGAKTTITTNEKDLTEEQKKKQRLERFKQTVK